MNDETRSRGPGSGRLAHQTNADACIVDDRFGEPSYYGMTHAELAAYIRQLRREGWQSWEIRVRFFGESA